MQVGSRADSQSVNRGTSASGWWRVQTEVIVLTSALLLTTSCDSNQHVDTVAMPTQAAPPQVSVGVVSCALDVQQGLILNLVVQGKGALRGNLIDATADIPVMSVDGTFGSQTRTLGWSTKASRRDDIMSLSLSTSELPSSIEVSHLTFTLLNPIIARADSLQGLIGLELWFGEGSNLLGRVDANINGIDVLERGVGIEIKGLTAGVFGRNARDRDSRAFADGGWESAAGSGTDVECSARRCIHPTDGLPRARRTSPVT